MAVVAGLFDSEVEATKAMDRLLREKYEDMDTRVIDGSDRTSMVDPGVLIPIIPNTSGSSSQAGNAGPIAAANFGNWLDDMDDVERGFYTEAVREGSSLALVKVKDENADRVRQLFRSFGARTYTKD